MQRVTVTLDDDLMGEIDRFMGDRGYSNRSEALRDLARAGIAHADEGVGADRPCVAALIYAYDPQVRDLARRLVEIHQSRRDLGLGVLATPLGADGRLEVALLEGSTAEVRRLAETITTERGVRHGRLVVVPLGEEARPVDDADGLAYEAGDRDGA